MSLGVKYACSLGGQICSIPNENLVTQAVKLMEYATGGRYRVIKLNTTINSLLDRGVGQTETHGGVIHYIY